jgi:hypothetical protein
VIQSIAISRFIFSSFGDVDGLRRADRRLLLPTMGVIKMNYTGNLAGGEGKLFRFRFIYTGPAAEIQKVPH